jgi:hypothetical protein
MPSLRPIRWLVFASASAMLVVAGAARAHGQSGSSRNPHEGEWTLEYRVFTRPGGEVVAIAGDTQRFNLAFQVVKVFTVAADGVLGWEQRDGGQLHVDDYSALAGRTWFQDQQPVLRLKGQAAATPAQPQSGRSYDRQLSLELAWSGGSGPGIDHAGKPFVISLSADGSQWLTSGYTRAVPYQKSQWELTPAKVAREEIGEDVLRETTTFRASRPVRLIDITAPLNIQATEQIDVRHVHYPRLVPRG